MPGSRHSLRPPGRNWGVTKGSVYRDVAALTAQHVLDVPAAFRRSPEDLAYLDGLVAFHAVTLPAVTACLLARAFGGAPGPEAR